MTSNPWKITYKIEPIRKIGNNNFAENGYYVISYNDTNYGFITRTALDEMNTDKILKLILHMLNHANELALKVVDDKEAK